MSEANAMGSVSSALSRKYRPEIRLQQRGQVHMGLLVICGVLAYGLTACSPIQTAQQVNPSGVQSSDPNGGSANPGGEGSNTAPESTGTAPIEDDGGPVIVNQISGVRVTTLVGSSVPGSQDGNAQTAGLNNPVGVALDDAGSLFVTEYDGARLRKITPDGTTSTFPSPAGFVGAFAVTLAALGQVFVQTDFDNTGTKTDKSGTIWNGSVSTGITAAVASGLGRPRGLAFLSQDSVVVADRLRHTLSLLHPANASLTLLAGSVDNPGLANGQGTAARFNAPLGVAVMPDESIVIADSDNHCIRRVQLDGTVMTFAGLGKSGMADGPSQYARFDRPIAIAVDSAGVVYVSDSGRSRRIRRISVAGVVETVAGNGTKGLADGSGGEAKFYDQEGIAVRKDGKVVYVADGNDGDGTGFHRIRKIDVP